MHTVHNPLDIGRTRIHQKRGEFVSAVTGDQVGGAERTPEGISHRPQDFVADHVAETIVDRIQVHDIQQQQDHAALPTARTGREALVLVMEGPPAGQPGQRVGRVAREEAVGVGQPPGQAAQQPDRQIRRTLEHLHEVVGGERQAPGVLDGDDRRRARLVGQHGQLPEHLPIPDLGEHLPHERTCECRLHDPHLPRQHDEHIIGRLSLSDHRVARRKGLLGRARHEVQQLFSVQRPKQRHHRQHISVAGGGGDVSPRRCGAGHARGWRRLGAATADRLVRASLAGRQRAGQPRQHPRAQHGRAEGFRQAIGGGRVADPEVALHGRLIREEDDREVRTAQPRAQRLDQLHP